VTNATNGEKKFSKHMEILLLQKTHVLPLIMEKHINHATRTESESVFPSEENLRRFDGPNSLASIMNSFDGIRELYNV